MFETIATSLPNTFTLEDIRELYHVNFKMAAALCREYFRTEGADYEKLLEEIGRHTVPVRPDR